MRFKANNLTPSSKYKNCSYGVGCLGEVGVKKRWLRNVNQFTLKIDKSVHIKDRYYIANRLMQHDQRSVCSLIVSSFRYSLKICRGTPARTSPSFYFFFLFLFLSHPKTHLHPRHNTTSAPPSMTILAISSSCSASMGISMTK